MSRAIASQVIKLIIISIIIFLPWMVFLTACNNDDNADDSPPYTINHSPARYATNVPTNTEVYLEVWDNDAGVAANTIRLWVGDEIVYPVITTIPKGYSLSYISSTLYPAGGQIWVRCDACDNDYNCMAPDSYYFYTTEEGAAQPGYWTGQTNQNYEFYMEVEWNMVTYIEFSATLYGNGCHVDVTPIQLEGAVQIEDNSFILFWQEATLNGSVSGTFTNSVIANGSWMMTFDDGSCYATGQGTWTAYYAGPLSGTQNSPQPQTPSPFKQVDAKIAVSMDIN